MTDHTISTPDAVILDGPCMFLFCLDDGPHGHDICPDCGAVRFGNASCATCVKTWHFVNEDDRATMLAAIEGRAS